MQNQLEKKQMEESRREAESGNPVEQYRLGLMYYHGQGVPQDYKEAVKWFKKSADQGYANAQCSLGICYRKGEGILVNYMEAVKLFRAAADQGDASAIYNLGICCYNGHGLEQDNAEAAALFKKAADLAYAGGNQEPGLISSGADAEPGTLEEAKRWYRETKELSNNLQARLQEEILKKDGRSLTNDVNIKKLKDMTSQKESLEKTVKEREAEIKKLIKDAKKQKTESEKSMQEYRRETESQKNRLDNRIHELEKRSVEQNTKIIGLNNENQQLRTSNSAQKDSLNSKDRTIKKHEETIKENTKIIGDQKKQIDGCRQIIATKDGEIMRLKTQKPFVKKSTMLVWVDIFALTVLTGAFYLWRYGWMNLFDGDTPQYLIVILLFGGAAVLQLLGFSLLKKGKHAGHGMLVLLTMAAVVSAWCFAFSEIFDIGAPDAYLILLPYAVIHMWSFAASFRKEVIFN